MAEPPDLTQLVVAEAVELPPAGTRRPGGRTARTRAAVLTAALAELAAEGYDRLTLDAVAVRARVHKTTVYRRWGGKERLVAEALQTLAHTRIDVPDTGDVTRDLQLLARSVVATLVTAEGGGTVRAMVSAAQQSDVVRALVTAFWAERTTQAGDIVRRAVQRGQLPADTRPDLVIRHLGAPLYHQLLVTLEPLNTATADLAAAATAAAARCGVFTTTDRP